MPNLGLGIGTEKSQNIDTSVWPISRIEFLWDASEVQLISGRVDVWPDQIGNLDWVTSSGGTLERFDYNVADSAINNQPVIINQPGSRMVTQPSAQNSPFVLYFVVAQTYSTNNGYIWRDTISLSSHPNIYTRASSNSAVMGGSAAGGNLVINQSPGGLHWNEDTNTNLTSGVRGAYRLLKFLWKDDGYEYYSNGILIASGNNPLSTPINISGNYVYFSTSAFWYVALHFGGFFEPTPEEDAVIISYVNKRFNLNI